ncbi:MAG: hypothetical protein OXQ28_08355, partial [Acidobacteriota bacterium]|nr:hypothetical protein [Acidobacteriota bacterium]
MGPQLSVPGIHRDTAFDNVPPVVRGILSRGFSRLVEFPSESLDKIASQLSLWLDPTGPAPKTKAIADELEVHVDTVTPVLMAVTFFASTVFADTSTTSVDSFVDKAVGAEVLQEGDVDRVRAFGKERLEAHRAAIRTALTREQSSTYIIPSFQAFDATVDLRVASVDRQRPIIMPLAIASLRTDVADRQL